ncbi:MAG: hypothetical protein ACRD6R_11170 [Candidatus Polarisedimenticolia bacterium]
MAAVVGTVALTVAGCSKTQDTAPETRVFGSPPVIESVSFQALPQAEFECDYTQFTIAYMCAFYAIPGAVLDGGIFISGKYTEVRMEARVLDPDSTPALNDVLLMGASFHKVDSGASGDIEEHTLVMYDDGSSNNFMRAQTSSQLGPLDCSIDEMTNECTCAGAFHQLNTNDAVAGDDRFTRHFAFVTAGTADSGALGVLFHDCLMRDRHQFPQLATDLPTYQFSFDAVDRKGNITRWHEQPIITVAETSAACRGDECACCLLREQVEPTTKCADLPGLVTPDYPNGVCRDLF